MNADLTGTVRMMGETDSTIRVEIHLEDEELRLVSRHGELGRWPLSDIGVAAKLDGFHLRIEGEELIVATNDDARFALALGIRSTMSPRLNRLLASARDNGLDAGDALAPSQPVPRSSYNSESAPLPPDQVVPVAIGLFGAAVGQVLAGVIVLASSSTVRVLGIIPAWLAWIVAAVTVAAGAFGLLNHVQNARKVVLAGAIVGLVTLAASLIGVGQPSFSWISDGLLFGGIGAILSGLLLGVDALNRGVGTT